MPAIENTALIIWLVLVAIMAAFMVLTLAIAYFDLREKKKRARPCQCRACQLERNR